MEIFQELMDEFRFCTDSQNMKPKDQIKYCISNGFESKDENI